MITVAGEALMDVVVGASGALSAFPGGAPFNVARTVARLGGECQYLGRLSADGFGEALRAALEHDGVRVAVPARAPEPTTLALAQLDEHGAASYSFYLEATSAARLRPGDVSAGVLDGSSALVLGGLGLTIDPTASTLRELVAGRPGGMMAMLDPNCRPAAIRDLTAYRQTIAALVAAVEIVKVSVEDLSVLAQGSEPGEAARELLRRGPSAVLLTDGPDPVRILTAAGERSVAAPAVEVVDTIGAGDAFVAALLTWWTRRSLTGAQVGDLDALTAATEAAVEVAAAACTVPGAGLPAGFSWSRA
jgi:fructokinase